MNNYKMMNYLEESDNNIKRRKLNITVLSQLSDVQELLNTNPEKCKLLINFVKTLLIKYGNDLNQWVPETELNDMWNSVKNRK